MSETDTFERGFQPWLVNATLKGFINLSKLLPYNQRLAMMGWFARRILGPAVRYRKRARANLAMVYPDMPEAQRHAIADQVLDGFGRTVAENYSRQTFRERIARCPIEGPGLPAALAARDAGRPIVFSCGHWSNHEAARTALDLAGFKVGGLYKPMANPYFNEHYVESITDVSGPVFPTGRDGTRAFMQFIAEGGHAFLLHDVYYNRGEWMDFLGHPAKTALTTGDLALRFDALLIPYFATRQPDGTSFKIELLEPIAHSDARTMVRALMDALEDRIAENPGQWMWIHRRWKGAPAPQALED
ncbi:MAG: lauroyl acyltransferase [Pseudomonadota bacterium]